ncbi:hypothetical protein DPMN_080986 [Dreissena polymorpha]|uniref:Uncharacterized protein n=1 Tax=Dreissena polymorpha TaxID=45954 RepID=A0A9D3Y4B9_DREPO|nr:hypothetical protein DPMN_080986 [Dreissena polymorpha]
MDPPDEGDSSSITAAVQFVLAVIRLVRTVLHPADPYDNIAHQTGLANGIINRLSNRPEMSPVFYFSFLVGVGFLATRDVTCITNKDFLELAIKYGAVQTEDYYVNDVIQKDDDVIFLPGNQDDELDVIALIGQLGITFSDDGSGI